MLNYSIILQGFLSYSYRTFQILCLYTGPSHIFSVLGCFLIWPYPYPNVHVRIKIDLDEIHWAVSLSKHQYQHICIRVVHPYQIICWKMLCWYRWYADSKKHRHMEKQPYTSVDCTILEFDKKFVIMRVDYLFWVSWIIWHSVVHWPELECNLAKTWLCLNVECCTLGNFHDDIIFAPLHEWLSLGL